MLHSRTISIEGISLLFTVGVFLGTLFPYTYLLPALVLPLICLCLYKKLWIPSLVLCGIFSYLTYSLEPTISFNLGWIHNIALDLGRFIDSLPIQDNTKALDQALLLGNRMDLSRDTVATFRAAGASHLLALSGLHMGIIYVILLTIFKPFKGKLKYWLIIGIALLFTLMVGATPSVTRAFFFILVYGISQILGRTSRLLRTLFIALLLQLIFMPTAINSIGFQLSYLAVLGIALIYPKLESMFPETSKVSPMRWIWKTLSLTISCQIFTAPLAWHYFHTFPKHFLLTNLIAIPVTTAFMVCSIIMLVLSGIGVCPGFIYSSVDFLAKILLDSLEIISTM